MDSVRLRSRTGGSPTNRTASPATLGAARTRGADSRRRRHRAVRARRATARRRTSTAASPGTTRGTAAKRDTATRATAAQQYGPPQQGYGYDPYQQPAPGWTAPQEERRKRGLSPVLILVLTLAVLVCGGTGVALYLVGRPDDRPTATSGRAPRRPPSASQAASQAPTQAASPTPGTDSSADARFVKKGQCVKNVGSTEKPQLQITKCAARTYEVLERFDTATTGEDDAQAKCKDVQGYTDWYYFNSPLDLNDYVLCLKLR